VEGALHYHPLSSSAEVKETVELLPLWAFMPCYRVNFTFYLIVQSAFFWIVTLPSCMWTSKIQMNMLLQSLNHKTSVSTYKAAWCHNSTKKPLSQKSLPRQPENLYRLGSSVVRRMGD
jgi:hypothetical protein